MVRVNQLVYDELWYGGETLYSYILLYITGLKKKNQKFPNHFYNIKVF